MSSKSMSYYQVSRSNPMADEPDKTKNQLVYQRDKKLYFVNNESIPEDDKKQLRDNLVPGVSGQGNKTWHELGINRLGYSISTQRGQVAAGGHKMGVVSPNSGTFNPQYYRDQNTRCASYKFVKSVKKALGE